jgi:hypothetical protein
MELGTGTKHDSKGHHGGAEIGSRPGGRYATGGRTSEQPLPP